VLFELLAESEDRIAGARSIDHDDQRVVLIIDVLPLDLPSR